MCLLLQEEEAASSQQQLPGLNGRCNGERTSALQRESKKETTVSSYSHKDSALIERFIPVNQEQLLYKNDRGSNFTEELSQTRYQGATGHEKGCITNAVEDNFSSACSSNQSQDLALACKSDQCHYTDSSAFKLKHIAVAINKERPFKCDQCTFTFSHPRDFQPHVSLSYLKKRRRDRTGRTYIVLLSCE